VRYTVTLNRDESSSPTRRLCVRRHLVCLFVSRITKKTTGPIFTKCGKKVAHGHRKKSLDFGGNSDHVMLGFVLGYGG